MMSTSTAIQQPAPHSTIRRLVARHPVAAFLVITAAEGRAGVRDLVRRSFWWRVGACWYLFALLGLPTEVVGCASGVVAVAAVLMVVFIRGRLSYKPTTKFPTSRDTAPMTRETLA